MWERLKYNLKSRCHESVSNESREFGEQIIYLLLSPAHQSALFISIRLLSLDLFVLLRYRTLHLRWREGGGRGQNTFQISVQTFFLQISRQVKKKGCMLEKQVLMIIFILSLTTVNSKATFCVVPVIINIIDHI